MPLISKSTTGRPRELCFISVQASQALAQEDSGADGGKQRPPAGVLQEQLHTSAGTVRILSAARGCGAVWKRSVDQDRLGAVNVGHRDERVVEVGVAAVSNEIIQVSLVAVLVAAAGHVRVTSTDDGLGLVLRRIVGLVVEPVRVVVVVRVCAIKPQAGPEGERAETDTE